MRIQTFAAAATAAALLLTGCSSSTADTPAADTPAATDSATDGGNATDTATDAGGGQATEVDPQILALGPNDLPDGFAANAIVADPGDDTADDCPALARAARDNTAIGTSWETSDGYQSVEIRVGNDIDADALAAIVTEIANCPDTTYTEDGSTIELTFDHADVPAGAAAFMTGTAAGFPFAAQFAAFEAGGHTVSLWALGLGSLPDGVDLADLVGLTVARGNGDADPAQDAPAMVAPGTTPTSDEDDEDGDGGMAAGSREQPLEVGQTARVGDWDVTVDEIIMDATDQMAAANPFNDPAENGHYALVTVTATYAGDDEGTAGWELAAVLSGANRVQYSDSDCGAVEPNPMFEQPTVEPGGTVTGQFCIDYPTEALGDSAVLFIEPLMSFDDSDRTFWALPTA